LLDPNNELNARFQFNPDEDPGYQFRLAEGQKALERSAAARGGLNSGGTLKALARYSQGVASDEFQRSFERFQAERKSRGDLLTGAAGTLANLGTAANGQMITAGNAYGSGVSGNLTRAAEFAGTAGMRAAEGAGDLTFRGSTAAGGFRTGAVDTAAGLRTNAAARAGDYTMAGARGAADAMADGANATAAGTIGRANAWTGAMTGVGTAAAGAYAAWKKPKPPTLAGLRP
jgi:hypothetical protein